MAITAIKNTFFIIANFLIVFELRCKSTANSDKAQFFPCFFVNEHETKACFCDKSEEKPQNLSHTSKSDLAIRPIYHRLFNRIEAHVCICFTAYTVLLELERTLAKTADKKNKKPGITIYRAKFLAESLYNIEYVNPYNGKKMSVMLRTEYDEEVTKLLEAIGMKP